MDTPYFVGGAGHDVVIAGFLSVPLVRPSDPHVSVPRGLEVCGVPGITSINAYVNVGYGARSAPGVTADHVNAFGHLIGVVVGLSDDGLDANGGDQFFVGVVNRVPVVVELVVIPALWHLGCDFKVGEPFDRPIARPARHK